MTSWKSKVGGRKNDCKGTACRALDRGEIEIWPEPSPEERAAILLALRQVTKRRVEESQQRAAAWAAAGREEAVHGRMVKTREGWGRGAGRMAGW